MLLAIMGGYASAFFIGLLTVTAHPGLAKATDIATKMFGQDVAITSKNDREGERLTVGGRELLRNRYLSIDEIGIVAGIPVSVGTSSNGGNACEGATFVLSFPSNGSARLDGPMDECIDVAAQLKGDRIELFTAAIPGRHGRRWTSTPDESFPPAGTTTFQANESRGWA